MPLRELLDELLTSLETGPLISAYRHFDARPAVYAPFPSSLDPRIVEALKGRGVQQLYSHQARAVEVVAKGEQRRRRDADGLGQDALLQPAGAAGPGRAARGARPLSVSDQGARPGPARGAERARQDPARHADVHVRRRHAAGRAALGARARQPRADQPRHAALGHPAAPHEVGEPLPEPPLRGDRRAARVPRGLRQPSRQRVAPAQAHLPPLRQRAAVHHGLGDHRQPARAGRALDRGAGVGGRGERRADGRESLPLLQPARWSIRSSASARRISARRPSSPTRFLKKQIATIVFAQSRLATEVLLATIKRAVEDKTGDSGMVRGYRGGYLPLRRREVEQGLRSGEVKGVVTTSALELGIDIGHLDVAVLAGYPGTIASMWQQAGRAGRRTGESLAVMVATSSPMDQYLAAHPDYLFGAPPEHARINPENPFILVNHLKCGAFELPFAAGELFGGDVAPHLDALEQEGRPPPRGGQVPLDLGDLSRRPPLAAHRHVGQLPRDRHDGRGCQQVRRRQIIAEVDWKSAFAMIYPKAIYMVEGDPFEVQELHYREDEEKVAYVKRVVVDYFTDAVSAKGVWILQHLSRQDTPGLHRRAGRGAGGGEGRRLQEDQDGHARERRRGRGRAAAAGDADDQRVARAPIPGSSPRSRRAGTSCSTACARSPTCCTTSPPSSCSPTSATWAPGSATARRRRRAWW